MRTGIEVLHWHRNLSLRGVAYRSFTKRTGLQSFHQEEDSQRVYEMKVPWDHEQSYSLDTNLLNATIFPANCKYMVKGSWEEKGVTDKY